MVRAVASRVIPRQRISKAMAKEASAEASLMQELATNADAPLTVNNIPTRASADFTSSRVGIRPMGNSRRVFLMDPHLKAEEMEGLAYRIHALSNNEAINSVLIATDDMDDGEMNCLPRFVTDLADPKFTGLNMDLDPAPNATWHVAGGYDPLEAAEQAAKPESEDQSHYLLESIRKLSLATIGEPGDHGTHVPIITMPHGVVTDSGYALCMGGYVLATKQTSFRILNPSRGLSLDPVGFSYLLPRLGWDNEQRSGKYPGCGMILALTGYEANCYDMVETGLATNLVSESDVLPILEYNLASILPWNQQKLTNKQRHFYGFNPFRDGNAGLKNVTVANLIEQLSEHSANAANSIPYDFTVPNSDDPALDTESVPWESGFFSSDLVDTAAHFDKIFQKEKSLEGIMERLREAGANQSEDPEEKENSRVANELVQRMERQSPLALRVVHQLLKVGSGRTASMENCMEREAKAQLKLFARQDFAEWAKHVRKHGDESKAPAFAGWQHKNVAAVTTDEVDEILS